jgi:flagellar hook-length control protein FliK
MDSMVPNGPPPAPPPETPSAPGAATRPAQKTDDTRPRTSDPPDAPSSDAPAPEAASANGDPTAVLVPKTKTSPLNGTIDIDVATKTLPADASTQKDGTGSGDGNVGDAASASDPAAAMVVVAAPVAPVLEPVTAVPIDPAAPPADAATMDAALRPAGSVVAPPVAATPGLKAATDNGAQLSATPPASSGGGALNAATDPTLTAQVTTAVATETPKLDSKGAARGSAETAPAKPAPAVAAADSESSQSDIDTARTAKPSGSPAVASQSPDDDEPHQASHPGKDGVEEPTHAHRAATADVAITENSAAPITSADLHAPSNSLPAVGANPVHAESVQPLGTTPVMNALPAAATWSAPAAVPLVAVPIEIAARFQAGTNRFEIRLDPPELGRIDVRLNVDRQGNVTSHLVVERSDTLDLLRRDAPQLERALQDAGLKTGSDGLQFSLRDQGFAQNPNAGANTPARFARIVVPAQEPVPSADTTRFYGRPLGTSGGIDIRV